MLLIPPVPQTSSEQKKKRIEKPARSQKIATPNKKASLRPTRASPARGNPLDNRTPSPSPACIYTACTRSLYTAAVIRAQQPLAPRACPSRLHSPLLPLLLHRHTASTRELFGVCSVSLQQRRSLLRSASPCVLAHLPLGAAARDAAAAAAAACV